MFQGTLGLARAHPGVLGKTMVLSRLWDRNVTCHRAIKVFHVAGIVRGRGLHSGRYMVQGFPQR